MVGGKGRPQEEEGEGVKRGEATGLVGEVLQAEQEGGNEESTQELLLLLDPSFWCGACCIAKIFSGDFDPSIGAKVR